MRIKALVAASAAVLVLAACGKAPEEKAETAPATDAVEAAGTAEDAALTVDQAAKDAEAAANQALQNDTAAAPAATTMQGADASAAAPSPETSAESPHA